MLDSDKKGSQEERLRELELKQEKLFKDQQKAVREFEALQARIARMGALYKKSVSALVQVARNSDQSALIKPLEQLESLVRNEAALELQLECFLRVEDRLRYGGVSHPVSTAEQEAEGGLNQAVCESSAVERESGFLPKLLGMMRALCNGGSPADAAEGRLSPEEEAEAFIECCVARISEERKQVVSFIAELSRRLAEVESNALSSLADSQEMMQLSQAFRKVLDEQMNEVRGSFKIGTSIEDIKQVVFTRLQTIDNALKSKSRKEEALLARTQERMDDAQRGLQAIRADARQVGEKTGLNVPDSRQDPLTGVYDRFSCDQKMREYLQSFRHRKQPFSVVLFDVDFMKGINEKWGRTAGDRCLAGIISRVIPIMDERTFLGRFDADTFLVILDGAQKMAALDTAERIRRLVESASILQGDVEIPVTVSLGVTQVEAADFAPQGIYVRVTTALKRAKNKGGNRVQIA